jgi:hypothetical protein
LRASASSTRSKAGTCRTHRRRDVPRAQVRAAPRPALSIKTIAVLPSPST